MAKAALQPSGVDPDYDHEQLECKEKVHGFEYLKNS
jgi:hypothetical protein